MNAALETQIGGGHYKDLPIQPAEYCQRNRLGFCESSVIKYVTRHREKNGRQDIEKAIHFLQILLDIEYPEDRSTWRPEGLPCEIPDPPEPPKGHCLVYRGMGWLSDRRVRFECYRRHCGWDKDGYAESCAVGERDVHYVEAVPIES